MKLFLLCICSLLISVSATADIQDRINSCEISGQMNCVFDLLREISTQNRAGEVETPFLAPKEGIYCITHCSNDTINAVVSVGENWVAVSNVTTFGRFSGLYTCRGRKCTREDSLYYLVIHRTKLITFHTGEGQSYPTVWKKPK